MPLQTTPLEAQAAAPPRLDSVLDTWKRKLIDVTKRNRALNFRETKVSTVTIIDEQPAEVFRRLYLNGGEMRFRPASNTTAAGRLSRGSSEQPTSTSTEDILLLEYRQDGLLQDFAPYDPQSLSERHMDNVLQTASDNEQLDRSLRRLDEQARLSLSEQGVNTLFLALGMLYFTEAPSSSEMLRAPLILLPVELVRKSARTGYVVRATEDDPVVNPVLAEYLRRSNGLALPELPDWTTADDAYDLQDFFQETQAAIIDQPKWAIKIDIYLALFSFQKLVMFKDLEKNAEAIKQHRLVHQLLTRSGSAQLGLPREITELDLDTHFRPENTYQVVDADSSQMRALAASSQGHDLVIEGPPGTGKSQTITNLVAHFIATNKTVLFVAEKNAALQVVQRRLVEAGLGEFCLELHSTKANKRAVMQSIRAALNASLEAPRLPEEAATQRLPELRQASTDYCRAVHTPQGVLGVTPYWAYGALGSLLGAPKVRLTAPINTVANSQFAETVREFEMLAITAGALGNPVTHPWRDTTRAYYSETDLDEVKQLSQGLLDLLGQVVKAARTAEERFGAPPVHRFADIDRLVRITEVISRSPGAPIDVLAGEAWHAPPPAAQHLVTRLRKIQQLKAELLTNFVSTVVGEVVAPDIDFIEQKTRGLFGVLAFADGRYRQIERRWRTWRLARYRPNMRQQAEALKKVVQLQIEQQSLETERSTARELFGALWQGEESNPEGLDGYIAWVVEFRKLCVQFGLPQRACEAASVAKPDTSVVNTIRESAHFARDTLSRLQGAVGWPEGYLQDSTFVEIGQRAFALRQHIGDSQRWIAFHSAWLKVAQGIAGELLKLTQIGEVTFAQLSAAFQRAFLQKWLDEAVSAHPTLRAFNTLTHEERLREFRRLDQLVLHENRIRLVRKLRDDVQTRLQARAVAAGMTHLRRELERQRRLSPLRLTMQKAGAAVRAIKPCFLMSPLSVAQYLDGTPDKFDVVIFDEASQLPTEEAIGAISRGNQLIVVGDPKQLPPTNFFTVMSDQAAVVTDEEGEIVYEDSESVLEEYLGAGLRSSRLRWHYRSKHEALIAFSNLNFYDADLYTFPSPEAIGLGTGVRFEFVPNGVYEGKGLNAAEARRVADAAIEHARQSPNVSLGVGTLNLRQQLAIQDELEIRRREDPELESFFSQSRPEPFFVKNLENIQGDERDVIFISITYGKATDGRLRYNFGPLNSVNGWRRLNVLVTRARQQMRVFASIHGDDINPVASTSQGPRLLRDFLTYAEHGRLDSPTLSAAANAESPFERDVYHELTRRGINLVPQVGVSGYRIDFGVLDEAAPGRFVCGLECDGVAYHASQTARDRDRLRQQVLEARGWIIHRIWSTDWFKDRAGQIDRLLQLIAQARQAAALARPDPVPANADGDPADDPVVPVMLDGDEPTVAPAQGYRRPSVSAYRMATSRNNSGDDLLAAHADELQEAISKVVEAEAPVHLEDLLARVAGFWGNRLGSRIRGRIEAAIGGAVNSRNVLQRGDFLYRPRSSVKARSRYGTRIPPERVAPEEYREATLLVLRSGAALTLDELASEVRAVLGFGRLTDHIQKMVKQQLTRLIEDKVVGQAAEGYVLRTQEG